MLKKIQLNIIAINADIMMIVYVGWLVSMGENGLRTLSPTILVSFPQSLDSQLKTQ